MGPNLNQELNVLKDQNTGMKAKVVLKPVQLELQQQEKEFLFLVLLQGNVCVILTNLLGKKLYDKNALFECNGI